MGQANKLTPSLSQLQFQSRLMALLFQQYPFIVQLRFIRSNPCLNKQIRLNRRTNKKAGAIGPGLINIAF